MSRADINNNPTNIKVPSGGLDVARQRYNDPDVTVDPNPATDGGHFLKFSSPEKGMGATSTLLDTAYSGMDVDSAMKKWSGGGYGADVAPSLSGKKISDLSPEEKATLVQSMAKREGYSGSNNPSLLQDVFGIKTANAQTTMPNKLSHDQLTANIDAMEKQGASQTEVQGYLDSLKQNNGPQFKFGSTPNNTTQDTKQGDSPVMKGLKQGAFENPLLKLGASGADVLGRGLQIGSQLAGKLGVPGATDFANKLEPSLQDVEKNGVDYGPLGKATPLGQTGSIGGDLTESLTTGLKGGAELSAITQGPALISKIFSKPAISNDVIDALGGKQLVSKMTPKDIYNGIARLAKNGDVEQTTKDEIARLLPKLNPNAPGLISKVLKRGGKLAWKGAKLAAGGELLRGGEDIVNTIRGK